MDIQVQEAQIVPNKINPKRSTPRHIIIKMVKIKDKERISTAAREKQLVMNKRTPISLSANYQQNFTGQREHNIKPRILYPTRLSFRFK